MEIKDLEGNVIQAGDRIAAAFRIGNSGVLRTGTVLGFGERANNITIQVQWDHASNNWPTHSASPAGTIVGAIDASLNRFVKIGDKE